jgi:thioester reductase-like protein
MFTSSTALASRYPPSPSSSPSSSSELPIVKVAEIPQDAMHPAPFGYAQAKWVCEQLLESMNQLFGPAVRASVVRLGQITGMIDNGAWNEWEHVPLMTRTSQDFGLCLICGG